MIKNKQKESWGKIMESREMNIEGDYFKLDTVYLNDFCGTISLSEDKHQGLNSHSLSQSLSVKEP